MLRSTTVLKIFYRNKILDTRFQISDVDTENALLVKTKLKFEVSF